MPKIGKLFNSFETLKPEHYRIWIARVKIALRAGGASAIMAAASATDSMRTLNAEFIAAIAGKLPDEAFLKVMTNEAKASAW